MSLLYQEKKKRDIKLKGVKYVYCDLANFEKIKKKTSKNYDYVFNFIGNVDHNNKKDNIKSHFMSTKNLLKIINKNYLKLFIQIGSSLEYGKKNHLRSKKFLANLILIMEKSNIWFLNI